jgi:AcrR family transcriptional regulator
MTTINRLPANDRKRQILDEALRASDTYGYTNITRQMIADHLQLAPGLVSHYFGTMDDLRHAVMQEAVRHSLLRIVAQGLVNKHPVAMRAPRALKARVAQSMAPASRA